MLLWLSNWFFWTFLAENKPIAVISVSDKTGVIEFARELARIGYIVVSTGGTFKELQAAGVECIPIERLTGMRELLDGRVKTLHPRVLGGILAKRNAKHLRDLRKIRGKRIEVVVCNLYQFSKKVAAGADHTEIVENVDIGGFTMLRSAAKNYAEGILAVCDQADYDEVIEVLRLGGSRRKLCLRLAAKVFRVTSQYEADISNYFETQIAN